MGRKGKGEGSRKPRVAELLLKIYAYLTDSGLREGLDWGEGVVYYFEMGN